jgi:ribosomal protein S12 methylthiotransferase accessory factor
VSTTDRIDSALRRAWALVDEWCGVVRHVMLHEVAPSDPPWFFATARLASTRGFSDVEAAALCGGAGEHPSAALLAALGEAIERYSIGSYREDELIRGTFAELRPTAVDPRRLVFFADEQYAWPSFPYARVDLAQPLSWTAGTSLVDGRERLVPAARVFTPYRAPAPVERIMQSTSTGAACHETRAAATLSALFECIERDAFTIAWLNRLPLPLVPADDLADADLGEAVARLARRGWTASLFDATSDLPWPTVVGVLAGTGDRVPALAFGAATRGSLAAAARKALIESAHTAFWVRTRNVGTPARFRSDFADVTTLNGHSLLYGDPAMRTRAAFLADAVPEPVRRFKAGARRLGRGASGDADVLLRECARSLHDVGLEAVAVDVTPSDVRDLGFEVVRVVVCDLHPLWGGHHVRCLGGERVRAVPVRMGYRSTPAPVAMLNDDPHPMP